MALITPFTPSIHPAYARLLVAHLRLVSEEFEDLFAGSNLSWDELIERQRFISFAQFSALAERAMAQANCPWLGLDISSIIQVSSHGPLGYGALASKNLKQAIELIEEMMSTRILIYQFTLSETETDAILSARECLPVGHLSEFVQVMLLGSLIDMLEKVGIPVGSGLKVNFSFPVPSWHSRYADRFPGVAINFGSRDMEISLPKAWMDLPCLTADDFAYRNAVRECEALRSQILSGGEWSDRVIERILKQPSEIPNLDVLAEEFAISPRTLIRKLKQEGVNYQGLVDEVRKDIATWSLLNSEMSIDQLAESLGFADTSNFARVFRRWFNKTPSEFRSSMSQCAP